MQGISAASSATVTLFYFSGGRVSGWAGRASLLPQMHGGRDGAYKQMAMIAPRPELGGPARMVCVCVGGGSRSNNMDAPINGNTVSLSKFGGPLISPPILTLPLFFCKCRGWDHMDHWR